MKTNESNYSESKVRILSLIAIGVILAMCFGYMDDMRFGFQVLGDANPEMENLFKAGYITLISSIGLMHLVYFIYTAATGIFVEVWKMKLKVISLSMLGIVVFALIILLVSYIFGETLEYSISSSIQIFEIALFSYFLIAMFFRVLDHLFDKKEPKTKEQILEDILKKEKELFELKEKLEELN